MVCTPTGVQKQRAQGETDAVCVAQGPQRDIEESSSDDVRPGGGSGTQVPFVPVEVKQVAAETDTRECVFSMQQRMVSHMYQRHTIVSR